MYYKLYNNIQAFQYGVDEEPLWFKNNPNVNREFNVIKVENPCISKYCNQFGDRLDSTVYQCFSEGDFIIRDFLGDLSVELDTFFDGKYTKCEEDRALKKPTYLKLVPGTTSIINGVPHFTLVNKLTNPNYVVFGTLGIDIEGRTYGVPNDICISEKTTKEVLKEYEKCLWKSFPKKTPKNNHHYLVHNKDGQMRSMTYENNAWRHPEFGIIAFRELPEI